jgi:hypothetical protein
MGCYCEAHGTGFGVVWIVAAFGLPRKISTCLALVIAHVPEAAGKDM